MKQRGVTLVELVVAITVIGVLASLGARMITGPARSFVQGGDRLMLIDTADRALRRVSDEVRASLPNSLRITQSGAVAWLEFLPASEFGRARMKPAATGAPGDPLDFGNTGDDRFDVFGTLPALYADTQLVIHNLGTPEGDAWSGNNRRSGVSLDVANNRLVFTPAGAFPSEPPTGRFALIRGPVSFRCEGAVDAAGNGIGTLMRYDGYAIQALQPVSTAVAPLSAATARTLATQVSTCQVAYDNAMVNLGVINLRLTLARGDARATLAHQILIDNTP